MTRFINRGGQVSFDLLILSAAYWLAFMFRFEFDPPVQFTKLLFFSWPYVVLFEYAVLSLFGVPRFAWRHVNLRDAQAVLAALSVSTFILVALRLGLAHFGGYSFFVAVPLGVLATNFVLAVGGVLGIRGLRRVSAETTARKQRAIHDRPSVRTLLVGAGDAGALVAREIESRPDLGMEAVGFLDDDPAKLGTRVRGQPVLGSTAELEEIARQYRVTNVLITIASATGRDIRRVTLACRALGLDTKIIPGIHEIVGGTVNLSRIREVAIEDLLGREPVELDVQAIAEVINERPIMITGAGGSIGSELCRQVCAFKPRPLLLVERTENALFEIHHELRTQHPEIEVVPLLVDVCNREKMERVFAEHRPKMVFHAAAFKHVPMMEWNPGEAIRNNVMGTRVVADLADRFGVSDFVMISTDKAVNPTSIMGASKRTAEIYVQALSARSKTRFVAVRFGNVLGSAGSVIPIFKRQIAAGGPITVTHPEMRRYFMTIPEATQLVLQAASMGEGGEIFILDMGEPVKIVDLARDLISLSGFDHEEIGVEFMGMRPGEKLFEELAVDDEQATKTRHPKIFIGRIRPHRWDEVLKGLKDVERVARSGDHDEVVAFLCQMVPEFHNPNADSPAAAV